MCFGTVVMMNIRNLRFGARDTWAGATDIHKTHYYVKQKPIIITHEKGDLEIYQIALQTAYEHHSQTLSTRVINQWKKAYAEPVSLGEQIYAEGYFSEAIRKNYPAGKVYNDILSR